MYGVPYRCALSLNTPNSKVLRLIRCALSLCNYNDSTPGRCRGAERVVRCAHPRYDSTSIIPIQIAGLELSGKFPTGLGIPPLELPRRRTCGTTCASSRCACAPQLFRPAHPRVCSALFLPRSFIIFVATLCGPVIHFTGAHGFVT